LRFGEAAEGDEEFRQLVLARIIEPTSKADSLRVLAEVGIDPPSYLTVGRRLRVFARPGWRARLAAAYATHTRLGPASLEIDDRRLLVNARVRHADPIFGPDKSRHRDWVVLRELKCILNSIGP
jgi:hypothetical protein